jgi:MFS-type transporter involved in bile tolerance (Atg22 family)
MALRSVVYVETLGIEKLTRTFGLCNLMLGVGISIGTPTLGIFKRVTGSYEFTFVASGVFFVASGILHFILPSVQQWEMKKAKSVTVEISVAD